MWSLFTKLQRQNVCQIWLIHGKIELTHQWSSTLILSVGTWNDRFYTLWTVAMRLVYSGNSHVRGRRTTHHATINDIFTSSPYSQMALHHFCPNQEKVRFCCNLLILSHKKFALSKIRISLTTKTNFVSIRLELNTWAVISIFSTMFKLPTCKSIRPRRRTCLVTTISPYPLV